MGGSIQDAEPDDARDAERSVLPPASPGGRSAAATPAMVVTPPRRRPLGNREWMLIGGAIVAIMAVCTVVGFVWLGRDLYSLIKERDQPLVVVQDYMRAVQAHDWARAHGSLNASLRGQNTLTMLQTSWLQREAANGAITGFTETNTNLQVINGQRYATLVGTIGYSKVAPEAKVLRLVKEGTDWKLATLP